MQRRLGLSQSCTVPEPLERRRNIVSRGRSIVFEPLNREIRGLSKKDVGFTNISLTQPFGLLIFPLSSTAEVAVP